MDSNQPTPSVPSDHVSELFDQWASTDRALQMAVGHQPLMETLLAELAGESHTPKALLDLGCGTGAFLAQATGFSRRCGIDVSPKMIDLARRTAPMAELKVGTFSDLPWPSASFDQVTTMEAIYYCLQPLAVLKEVVRVLKPGGRFDLVIDYYQDSPGTASWPEGLGFEITCLSSAQWTELVYKAGFGKSKTRRMLRSQAQPNLENWSPSLWFPTQESYAAYLQDGALWITGYLV